MKKEFTINGQIIEVDLQEMWIKPLRNGEKYNGSCIKSDEEFIGFFVFGGRILVFVNDNVFDVADIKIVNQLAGEYRTLTIVANGKTLLKKEYRAQTGYDMNYFFPTEEEDVDDLLWIAEVLNDAERRKVILRHKLDSIIAYYHSWFRSDDR